MSLADLLLLRPEFRTRTLSTGPIEQAVEQIERAFPEVGSRAPSDVDATIDRVADAQLNGDWSGITSGDVALVLRAYFNGKHVMPDALRQFLAAEANATTNPRLLDALVRAYLETWEAGSPKTQVLCRLVLAGSQKLDARWRMVFHSCPGFLDLEAGPAAVGKRMVDVPDPYLWLKSIGLPAPHEQGFMRHAHAAFLEYTPEPQNAETLEKLVSWVTPSDAPALFDSRAAEVVDRILAPWVEKACPARFQEICVGRLLDRFGDPRNENPAFWGQVDEPNKRVIFKWLARKSMQAMFEVVTEAERHSASGHQWRDRGRFWLSLYDEGRIEDAWVALGEKAIPVARSLHQRTQDKAYLSFGRQISRPDTCLLIMKIGTKIVVEGSHNFRVHVFPTPTRRTPLLYANTYNLNDIVLPQQHQDAKVHLGEWMDWVRMKLR